MDEEFEVVFHQGGKLVNDGKLKYEGGETSRFTFDPDVWSYFVIVSVVKSLGYDEFKEVWYSIGGASVLDDKLECLCDYTVAMHVVNLARLNGEAHVFVIHLVSEAQVIHMLMGVDDDEEQVEVETIMEEEVHGVEQVSGVLEELGGEEQEMGEQVQVQVVMEEEVHGVEQVGGVLKELVCEEQEMVEQVQVQAVMEGDVDGEVQVEKVGGHGEDEGAEQNEVELDVEIISWNSSSESGSGDGNTDWLEGLVDVNVGCNMDDDIHADLERNVEAEVQSLSNECSGPCSSDSDSISDVNVEGGNNSGLSDDE
ncbi:hypothetical protein V8G54_004519 [Vigna mungo]|uniref:PB1-like domain-containing protein n=1 Tax=Vigna mungo TaxID=3915 RepID=A0AAQ3PEE6_VIGMU